VKSHDSPPIVRVAAPLPAPLFWLASPADVAAGLCTSLALESEDVDEFVVASAESSPPQATPARVISAVSARTTNTLNMVSTI
jgi:hypothetical protein